MKSLSVRLFLVLLAVVCMLSNVACGKTETSPSAGPTQTPQPTENKPVEATSTADAAVVMQQLIEKMQQEFGDKWHPVMEMAPMFIENYYEGIGAIANHSMSIYWPEDAGVNNIVLIRLQNKDDYSKLDPIYENYKTGVLKSYNDYYFPQEDIVKEAIIGHSGEWCWMLMAGYVDIEAQKPEQQAEKAQEFLMEIIK